ncbi:LptF/LptG family permease [Kiritimatiellota bacterium B12222]|nr:LptF/LptG family permease [Kiritimatiellota bacterium B12222]
MKTLHRYILRDYLTLLGMSMMVTTLVLYLGSVMKGLDYIAQGVPGTLLIKVFTLNLPFIFTLSIPVSCLIASLLLFNRLSLDGEITALRSGGLNTLQIISPVIFCAIILSLGCLLIQTRIAPDSRFNLRKALVNVSEINPIDLLEEGRFVEFPGLAIWIDQKNGTHIKEIEIHERNTQGDVVQIMNAKSGEIETHQEFMNMRVRLHHVQVLHVSPDDPKGILNAKVVDMDAYDFDLSYEELLRNSNITRTIGDMRISQLIGVVKDSDKTFAQLDPLKKEKMRMRALVETHKRLGLSLGCLSFTLMGIPLGMNRSRRESNLGIPLGLSLVLVFYTFISAADSLRYSPWFFPDYLIWVPVLVLQIYGCILIGKMR